MSTGGLIPVALAALAAAAVSWWAYARLEEAVPGRIGPAALRGIAVFLVLAGWWLPPLWTAGRASGTSRAVLVDRSLSMSLPASAGGPSRVEEALRIADTLTADSRFWFGDSVAPASLEAGDADPPTAPDPDDPDDAADGSDPRPGPAAAARSRLTPGLEAARSAGADSAIVLTDGELDDREGARSAALRLGLAVREVRVASGEGRLAIRGVDVPVAVEVGDTVRVVVEVGAVGDGMEVDSASLSVGGPDGTRVIQRFAVPAPGRSARIPVGLVATAAGGDAWQAFDVRLEPDADPFGSGTRWREWVEIVPTAAGALIVAADPDWEPHYLLPLLGRTTAGGARAWLRVGSDRWIRSGTERMPSGADARVRSDALRAELLVVQGIPGQVPAWLTDVASRHPRVLWLARGPGRIPGSDLVVGPAHAGEWYPGSAPLTSPIAGFIHGLDHPGLPPVARLFALSGFEWAPFELRRNRAGTGQPPIGVDRIGGRRRAVVAAEGLWRWAARAGAARQAYRSVYAGLAGWLLEAAERRPLELERTRLAAGDTVRWRVAPEVRDLQITLRDSAGAVVWADTVAIPDSLVTGPSAPVGSLRFEAEGTVAGESFRTGRPFESEGAERELRARAPGPPLEGTALGKGAPPPAAGRPMWPFVLAALMLCGEWLWRRRIGLR